MAFDNRAPFPPEEALEALLQQAGAHFDADAFRRIASGADATFRPLLDEVLASGTSCGNAMSWLAFRLPPSANLPIHCHSNMELDLVIRGSVIEWRMEGVAPSALYSLAECTFSDLAASSPASFRNVAHPSGSVLWNEPGSVHQTCSGPDGAVILALASKWTKITDVPDSIARMISPVNAEASAGFCCGLSCRLRCAETRLAYEGWRVSLSDDVVSDGPCMQVVRH